ncbi:hypothetical protein BJV78DRAFT_318551 [Lactifluus subvellereus]|nr:hypothetical protein BJV78DRAFT_318551 [Lactifluus subvellereus]
MDVCLNPSDRQESVTGPPMWSILVYMLLTETLDASDGSLRQQFSLPVPLGDTSLSNRGMLYDAQGLRRLKRCKSHSGKLPKASGEMVVQCVDALPMTLSFTVTPKSQSDEEQLPFVHLDRRIGGGWSSVYASSRSHVIVKFFRAPKKDKAELERQLTPSSLAPPFTTTFTFLARCLHFPPGMTSSFRVHRTLAFLCCGSTKQ